MFIEQKSKIFIACLIVTQLGWTTIGRAGNGAGTSGPVLTGTSIPVQVERGVTIADAQKSVATCLILGDSSRGLVPVADRLAQMLFPSVEFKNREGQFKEPHLLRSPKGVDYGGSIRSEIAEPNWKWVSLSLDDKNRFLGDDRAPEYILFVGLSSKTADLSYITLTSDTIFPNMTWKSLIKDSQYDELGEPHFESHVLEGVTITVPPGYGEGGEKITFTNNRSHKKTNLVLDSTEYVECLQTEIQRSAQK